MVARGHRLRLYVRISVPGRGASTEAGRRAAAAWYARCRSPDLCDAPRCPEGFALSASRRYLTAEDSHSGFNALRHHLLPYRLQRGANLYRESVGPLYTPRRVVDAVIAGTIDVGPLDSYALDLMLRHEPELERRIRVVSTTDAAPIPFLVAAPQCPDEIVTVLRAALMGFGEATECAAPRDSLCLHGFAPVSVADYDVMANWDQEARAAGFALPT